MLVRGVLAVLLGWSWLSVGSTCSIWMLLRRLLGRLLRILLTQLPVLGLGLGLGGRASRWTWMLWLSRRVRSTVFLTRG